MTFQTNFDHRNADVGGIGGRLDGRRFDLDKTRRRRHHAKPASPAVELINTNSLTPCKFRGTLTALPLLFDDPQPSPTAFNPRFTHSAESDERDLLKKDGVGLTLTELPYLLEAAKVRNVKILWVMIGHCMYEHTELSEYQAVTGVSRPWNKLRGAGLDAELKAVCKAVQDATV